MRENQYVIGVDGGGTKTVAALADLKGKILMIVKTGSASPRNVGLKEAVKNVAEAIKRVLRKKMKIVSTFLGLPCLEEEFKNKKWKIKKELLKYKEVSPIFKGKLIIGSDQLAGFRSGTNEKDGVVLISGSGCVAHGWRNKKEVNPVEQPRLVPTKSGQISRSESRLSYGVKVDGWGYLSEMGSGFFIGQKVIQAVFKDLDERGEKTLLTKFLFQKLKIKNKEDLITLIYAKNPMEIVPTFSILCDKVSKRGDKIAKNILREAGKELALSANTVIKQLNFKNQEFPLVLIGGLFKAKIVLDTVKKEVKKFAPKVQFILPKTEPVIGAVKLAIEAIKK